MPWRMPEGTVMSGMFFKLTAFEEMLDRVLRNARGSTQFGFGLV